MIHLLTELSVKVPSNCDVRFYPKADIDWSLSQVRIVPIDRQAADPDIGIYGLYLKIPDHLNTVCPAEAVDKPDVRLARAS